MRETGYKWKKERDGTLVYISIINKELSHCPTYVVFHIIHRFFHRPFREKAL